MRMDLRFGELFEQERNNISDLDSVERQALVLQRDTDEITDILARTLTQRADVLRDDLRDKGMDDGPEMEEYVHDQLHQWEVEAVQDYTGRQSNGENFDLLVEDIFDESPPGDFREEDTEDALIEDELSDIPQEEIEDEEEMLVEDCLEDSVSDVPSGFDYSSVDWDSIYAEIQSETQAFRDVNGDATDADDSNDENTEHIQASESQDTQTLSDVSGWLNQINPNFDAFDPESPYCNNCGSCAYAVYQRLEGNADSCASAENIGYNNEMNALTGMEQVSMSPTEIEHRLLSEGDGAHAIIGIDRAQGPGHWFNAACLNGRVVAIDGQTGEITEWPPDYGDVVNWEMSIKKEV